MNRGKLTIITMFSLAVAAATFAWWYQWQHLGQAIEFWGTDSARLIRSGKNAELMVIKPPTSVPIGSAVPVQHRILLTGKRGLIHARQAMIEDVSFNWEAAPDVEAKWQYAMRFWDNEQHSVTVLIDLDSSQVRLLNGEHSQTIADRLRNGLIEYLAIILKEESILDDGQADTSSAPPIAKG